MTLWRAFAPAKLNLYLHVTGRRADGMHLIDGLVAFAAVGDEITASPADEVSLSVTGPFAHGLDGMPQDNLVWRAAAGLARRLGIALGASLHLVKNLPVASGIGGGSSDAAASLRVLSALWHCDRPDFPAEVAASLGSDVPACLMARPLWLGGIGDGIQPAAELPECGLVLINPRIPLPTPSVYRARAGGFSRPDRFAIPSGIEALATLLGERNNDLTEAAIALVPEIGAVLTRLGRIDTCLLPRMSGSGATCFGLFRTLGQAEDAARMLRAEQPQWWIAAATWCRDGTAVSGPAPNV